MNTQTIRIATTTGEPDLRFTDEKKQAFNLRIKPSFRHQVDAFAKQRGMKRVQLVEEALRFYMAVHTHTNGQER
jgi:hypothetical protein